MNKKVDKLLSSVFVASLAALTCFQTMTPNVIAAEKLPEIEFSAVDLVDGKEGTGVSLTEEREFVVRFEPTQESLDESELLEAAKGYEWSLSREEGYQDSTKFPHQYLGGKLEDWKVLKTNVNEEAVMR